MKRPNIRSTTSWATWGIVFLFGMGASATMGQSLSHGSAPGPAMVNTIVDDGWTTQPDKMRSAVEPSPAVVSVESIAVEPHLVDESNRLLGISLREGGLLIIEQVDFSISQQGERIWHGRLVEHHIDGSQRREKVDGLALLVAGAHDVWGLVRSDDREWELRPLGEGSHILVESDLDARGNVDDRHLIPHGDPQKHKLEESINCGTSAPSLPTRIDILVAVDQRLTMSQSAAEVLAQGQVQVTNGAFRTSEIPVQLQLVGTRLVDDVPSVGLGAEMGHLVNPTDGVMDAVHTWRDELGADIVVLLSATAGACGVAASIHPTSEEAFAIVSGTMFGCDATFPHEVGHLLSANHEPTSAFPGSTKPYAHGFFRAQPHPNQDPGYVTIMSYRTAETCPNERCRRVFSFSNPRVLEKWDSLPTGTFETHDNARAITCEAPRIAAFRSGPVSPPQGSITSDSPCYLFPGQQYCTMNLQASAQNAGVLCAWRTGATAPQRLSCNSGGSTLSFAFQATQQTPTTIELRSHGATPPNSQAGYNSGVSLDTEVVQGQRVVNTFPTAGGWYNPDRPGNGLNISYTSDGSLLVYWATFDAAGAPLWFVSNLAPMQQGVWTDALVKYSWNGSSASGTAVGSARIGMLASNELVFEWNLGAQSGVASTGSERLIHLYGGTSYTGAWFEPALQGWGLSLDVEGWGATSGAIATIYYYGPSGNPTWAWGYAEGNIGTTVRTFDLLTFTGHGLCPSCSGQPINRITRPGGSMGLGQLESSPRGWTAIQSPFGTWTRGAVGSPIAFARLTSQ